LKGDYYRYVAEAFPQPEDNPVQLEAKEEAAKCYKLAEDISKAQLDPCNPIRLGLTLNLALFYYHVLDDKRLGKAVASDAIIIAEDNLDKSDESTFKETKQIL
jgi:hypothetical protein